jgi:hypothetical protein
MIEHTPRPWSTDERSGHAYGPRDVIVGRDGERVAVVGTISVGSLEEAKANARLIAAAPDLLAAAKRALEELEIAHDVARLHWSKSDSVNHVIFEMLPERSDSAINNLKAAIAKARGQQGR